MSVHEQVWVFQECATGDFIIVAGRTLEEAHEVLGGPDAATIAEFYEHLKDGLVHVLHEQYGGICVLSSIAY